MESERIGEGAQVSLGRRHRGCWQRVGQALQRICPRGRRACLFVELRCPQEQEPSFGLWMGIFVRMKVSLSMRGLEERMFWDKGPVSPSNIFIYKLDFPSMWFNTFLLKIAEQFTFSRFFIKYKDG
jgi:hypothetical protein